MFVTPTHFPLCSYNSPPLLHHPPRNAYHSHTSLPHIIPKHTHAPLITTSNRPPIRHTSLTRLSYTPFICPSRIRPSYAPHMSPSLSYSMPYNMPYEIPSYQALILFTNTVHKLLLQIICPNK